MTTAELDLLTVETSAILAGLSFLIGFTLSRLRPEKEFGEREKEREGGSLVIFSSFVVS
jgi:hypothetical protein